MLGLANNLFLKPSYDRAFELSVVFRAVTDVVGECITTALTRALQGVMGNERSSASAVVIFL